jgi:hypothetical protein
METDFVHMPNRNVPEHIRVDPYSGFWRLYSDDPSQVVRFPKKGGYPGGKQRKRPTPGSPEG